MILIVPIVLGILAGVAGVTGVAAGAKGIGTIKEAEEKGKQDQQRYEKAIKQLEVDWQETNRLAGSYGRLQLRVRKRIVERFVEFIRRTGRKASQSDQQFLEGLQGISDQQLQEFKTLILEAEDVSKGLIGAGAAGFAAGSGAVGIANAVGTVVVPQFFGLFAKQVAVAELGLPGVALWLGGGNALIGGAVLGGIALGPALAVGGFQLAGKGEKALTQAREYEAKVNLQIADIKTAKNFLKKVEQQIREIGILVRNLESRASQCLNELESEDFDPIGDVAKFQQAALLVTALAEISKTPILDRQGDLNPTVVNVQAKYQTLGDV